MLLLTECCYQRMNRCKYALHSVFEQLKFFPADFINKQKIKFFVVYNDDNNFITTKFRLAADSEKTAVGLRSLQC